LRTSKTEAIGSLLDAIFRCVQCHARVALNLDHRADCLLS